MNIDNKYYKSVITELKKCKMGQLDLSTKSITGFKTFVYLEGLFNLTSEDIEHVLRSDAVYFQYDWYESPKDQLRGKTAGTIMLRLKKL